MITGIYTLCHPPTKKPNHKDNNTKPNNQQQDPTKNTKNNKHETPYNTIHIALL